jgi:hypothetical protein
MRPDNHSSSTIIIKASQLTQAMTRAQASARVGAIISRRASAAGITDAAYFREILAGTMPRVTFAEAVDEPSPS